MKCNGCGADDIELTATFSYGSVWLKTTKLNSESVDADYHKTLCPKCTRVLKSILLNSDLSDHWEKEDFEDG